MKAFLKGVCRPLFRAELLDIEALATTRDAFSESSRRTRFLGRKLEEEQRSRSALEISNASLQRENELLRSQVATATENERFAMRMMVNFWSQGTYGVKPYPAVPGLPDNTAGEPVAPPEPVRMQGLDMVNRSNQEFLAEARRRQAKGEHLPVPLDQLEAMLFNR